MGRIYFYTWRLPMGWIAIAASVLTILYLYYYSNYSEKAMSATVASLSWVAANRVIVIDPGHGGDDPGAIGSTGALEKTINLEVAKRLAQVFREAGATVYLTRETDEGSVVNNTIQEKRDDLAKRVEVVKEKNADLFLSIHVNSFPSPRWSGAQTFYDPKQPESKKMALAIQQEMTNYLGNKDGREAKAEDFYVLRNSPCTAVMVEIGFISNPEEEKNMLDPVYQGKIAFSIYAGVIKYLSGAGN